MKKILTFLLLTISLLFTSSCVYENNDNTLAGIKPIDEKLYWEGSIDNQFFDNKVIIIIDKAFTKKSFTINDFKDLNLNIKSIELLTPNEDYDENNPKYNSWRNMYLIVLNDNDKEKVIEAINILIELSFVYHAQPYMIYEISNPIEGPNFSFELYFNNIIKEDYLSFLHSQGETETTIDDIEILNNYGTYNGAVVVLMKRPAWTVLTTIIIDGVKFKFNDSNLAIVWKAGQFFELSDAYDSSILTKDDLLSLAEKINK